MRRPLMLVAGVVVMGLLLARSKADASAPRVDIRVPGVDSPPVLQQVFRRGKTLEPLSTRVLRQRSIDSFPAGYLTFIAIIQGVALGIVVTETVKRTGDASGYLAVLDILGQGIFTFVSIVVVTYEYLWFTTIMRWTPTFRDTLIPYVLGLGETVPPLLMGTGARWWASASVFIGLAVVAFIHTLSKATEEMFEKRTELHRPLIILFLRLIAMCLLGTLYSVGICIWILLGAYAWVPPAAPLFLILTGAVIAILSERYLNHLYSKYEVVR